MSERPDLPHARLGRRALLAGGLGAAAAALLPGCSGQSPAPGAPIRPSGFPSGFAAAQGVILDPDDHVFVPVGANVGTVASFDWKGDARRHAADAIAWGWNTIRLNLMVTGTHSWSYVAKNSSQALLDLVAQVVAEYSDAGIVVILDAHDNPKTKGADQAAVEAGMSEWWTQAAAAFKDNPRVWSGLINEPSYANDAWVSILDTLSSAVRGTGNRNPILLGAPCWGQDVGGTAPYFTDVKSASAPDMAPALAAKHGNVILEQHNWGAYSMYTTADKLTGYIDTVRAAGLTPLIGEFGYTTDRSSTAGDYAANREAAQAVFDVAGGLRLGALWWHATHGDHYSLTTSGDAFWTARDGQGLSEAGARLWALGHPDR